jgi:hypothetical protein
MFGDEGSGRYNRELGSLSNSADGIGYFTGVSCRNLDRFRELAAGPFCAEVLDSCSHASAHVVERGRAPRPLL